MLSDKLRKEGDMRTFGIWVFGLLASAIVGAIIGSKFEDLVYPRSEGFWGALSTPVARKGALVPRNQGDHCLSSRLQTADTMVSLAPQ